MKELIILAVLLALFGVVGRIDYEADMAMSASRIDQHRRAMEVQK